MIEVRQALTMSAKEREAFKAEHPEIVARAAKMFNGGKICGQCKHFAQMGTRQGTLKHTGMNGNCAINQRNDYIKPESISCRSMEKIA